MSPASDHLHQMFADIFAETNEKHRHTMIDRVLTEHSTVFTKLARELINRFNIHKGWEDDVRQIVRTQAWLYLSKGLKDGYEPRATLPCIRVAAKSEVQRMRQSGAYTGVSGAVTARRRESALAKHRMDLIRTLGYEPDDRALVESYNHKVAGDRSEERARHQGALATMDDLRVPRLTELDEGLDAPATQVVVEEVEVRELICEIMRRCRSESDQVGSVAEVVLGEGLSDSPGEATWTASHVIKYVDMSSSQVARMLQRVRAIAVEVVDEWGLRDP